MSVEVNSCEELHIQNMNEKTAAVCASVGAYLISNWGINELKLCVDGRQYACSEAIAEGSELAAVCKELAEAKEIRLAVRACGSCSVGWRLESSFMQYFTDDTDVKANVSYRCTEFYDTDNEIMLYRYGESGLQRLGYTDSAAAVADIREWYCYNPVVIISNEAEAENAQLHERLMQLLGDLCKLLRSDEKDIGARIEDDWEDYGEITVYGGAIFKTENIAAITAIGNELAALANEFEDTDLSFALYAIPDGEGDYNFASVAIELNEDTVYDRYCRF